MLVLVLDTSSAAVTAGIVELTDQPELTGVHPRLLAEQVIIDARAHGERLAPAVRDCLAEAGTSVGELKAVVAGVGPGPFTGLRVGLVTAAAIADAAGLPGYPVCSLDAIAAGHPEVGELLVAGDARRKEVYWARYSDGRRIGEPAVDRPAELADALAGVQAMAGAGAEMYAEQLGLPLLPGRFPTVTGLATVAAGSVLAGRPGQPLTPLYLRRPDAVAPAGRKPVRT
ncbi:MAG TPA: tRNA (adenosine(37)-N6)-threonylcarbamoyltransferase complex dimerization subunit type 1 TsaB [Jatrophihabitans sp.]|nr:tRNA (adenosine(37)-N6)-threonylcarbamoyltransferase complex dimerization subunit type 1 TsaB [Jatrophihabitans sp.]